MPSALTLISPVVSTCSLMLPWLFLHHPHPQKNVEAPGIKPQKCVPSVLEAPSDPFVSPLVLRARLSTFGFRGKRPWFGVMRIRGSCRQRTGEPDGEGSGTVAKSGLAGEHRENRSLQSSNFNDVWEAWARKDDGWSHSCSSRSGTCWTYQ